MSYQTTIARAEVRAAEYEWKMHWKFCPTCSSAVDAKRLTDCCGAGRDYRQVLKAARANLDAERKLDRAPIPGQGTLP